METPYSLDAARIEPEREKWIIGSVVDLLDKNGPLGVRQIVQMNAKKGISEAEGAIILTKLRLEGITSINSEFVVDFRADYGTIKAWLIKNNIK